MNKIWKISKMPIVVGFIAVIIYIIDQFLGNALVSNGSFMWVAFTSWTIFFGSSIKERIQALLGNIIGFLFALFMFHCPSFFGGDIFGISIAGILGVFIANGCMMLFKHTEKIWLNSISGIFMGVFLTFSGFGVKLYPTTLSNSMLALAILLIYSALGLSAGLLCKIASQKKIESSKE